MLSITIIGGKEIVRKLDRAYLLGPPIKRLLNKCALFVEGHARKGAKPHAVDTGELARSIQHSLAPAAVPLWAKVTAGARGKGKVYAYAAEYGRRPGKFPPVAAIADWVRRHKINAPPFVIARAIARRGTKGLFYMRKAQAAAGGKMNRWVKETAREIERRF